MVGRSVVWLVGRSPDNRFSVSTGGGVALYVRDTITFNLRPDLAVDGLEAVWIELLFPRTKGILVCTMYRPPMDSSFLSKMESSLSKIDPGTEFHILGDFNIDFFMVVPLC